MAEPIEDIIGDYRAFAALQRDRLAARGIDITACGLSTHGFGAIDHFPEVAVLRAQT